MLLPDKIPDNQKETELIKRLGTMAFAGVLIYVFLDVMLQMLPPHYSLKQAESDLAVGSFGWFMRINFILRSLFSAALIVAIYKAAKNTRLSITGLVFFSFWSASSFLLAFFNTDVATGINQIAANTLHGDIHLLLVFIGFICAPVGIVLVSASFQNTGYFKSFEMPAMIISILTALAFFYLGLAGIHAANFGIIERVCIGLVLGWIAFVGFKLRRYHA